MYTYFYNFKNQFFCLYEKDFSKTFNFVYISYTVGYLKDYGEWTVREYMTTSDDWRRVIESRCSFFSLGALFYKVVSKQNDERACNE